MEHLETLSLGSRKWSSQEKLKAENFGPLDLVTATQLRHLALYLVVPQHLTLPDACQLSFVGGTDSLLAIQALRPAHLVDVTLRLSSGKTQE